MSSSIDETMLRAMLKALEPATLDHHEEQIGDAHVLMKSSSNSSGIPLRQKRRPSDPAPHDEKE